MSFRGFLTFIIIGALLAWLTSLLLLIYINPNEAGALSFLFFYLSLLLALVGTFSVIGLFVRIFWLKQDDLISHQVVRTFRQALFFGIFVEGLLYLSSKNLLNWWTTTLFIITLTILEFFFIAYKKNI